MYTGLHLPKSFRTNEGQGVHSFGVCTIIRGNTVLYFHSLFDLISFVVDLYDTLQQRLWQLQGRQRCHDVQPLRFTVRVTDVSDMDDDILKNKTCTLYSFNLECLKFRFTALQEGIVATLNLRIQALKGGRYKA